MFIKDWWTDNPHPSVEPQEKGWPIERARIGMPWRYTDTGEEVYNDDGVATRPCRICNKKRTDKGHDHCIRDLPGVKYACCGHGDPQKAYIYWENGLIIRGFKIDQKEKRIHMVEYKPKKQVIAVDFDGTVVVHAYPKIGRDIGAVPVLKRLVEAGHKIILFTMRGSKELVQAREWFTYHDIPLYATNDNPSQHNWTKSPKVYANMYIDDLALGTPLLHDEETGTEYVDWESMEALMEETRLI